MDPSGDRWRNGDRGYRVAARQGMGVAMISAFWHKLDEWMLRLAWLPSLVLLAAIILIMIQAADRRVPFQVLSVEPSSAKAGDMVTIRAKVWRDTSRHCSAVMARSIFDSEHVRYDFPIHRFSDEVIDAMEQATPGHLAVRVMVPHGASVGAAELVSVLEYRCNKVHALWPVEVTTRMPFTVLP